MIDFTPLRKEEVTIADLAVGLGAADLRELTNEMLDLMNSMIILSASESVQKEFGDDITGIIKRNIRKMEEVLEALTGLKEITPEMIREISAPTET